MAKYLNKTQGYILVIFYRYPTKNANFNISMDYLIKSLFPTFLNKLAQKSPNNAIIPL